MLSYLHFLRQNAALLGFGFLCVFWGNFGQSFFVSWFGGEIQRSLGISASVYGTAYSLATLASAITVIWGGALIDRVSLSRYSSFVAIGLSAACAVLAFAPNFIVICVGFYLLRFFGQALFPHTGVTTMARYFEADRGKAISIAGSGVPVGEIILPILAVLAMSFIGWRNTLLGIAVMTILICLPLGQFCLRSSTLVNSDKKSDQQKPKANSALTFLLKDKRYLMALPGLCAIPFIITGIFIHQGFIIEAKQWTPVVLARCFVIYGVSHWLAAMAGGFLVDRYSARRLLPYFLFSLIIAQLLLAYAPGVWFAPVIMSLLGLAIGLAQPISGALWAEVYGADLIGSIRSVNVAVMVLASSISPVLFGVLIDTGTSIATLFSTCATVTFFANIMLFFSYGYDK